MDSYQDIRKHNSITSIKEVGEICQPLQKLGISFFVYSRIYPNKKRLFLCNNPFWYESFLMKYSQNIYLDSSYMEENIKHSLFIVPEMYPTVNTFQDAKNLIGLRSGIIIPIQYAEYKEVCYFASEKMDSFQYNYYMDNMDMFLKFIHYFKNRAHRIICRAEKYTISPPVNIIYPPHDDISSNQNLETTKKQFISEIKSRQFYLPFDKQQTPISDREHQCIRLIIQGKSTKEIALFLNISQRTVETYILNMKNKFNCSKTSQLIYKLSKFGL